MGRRACSVAVGLVCLMVPGGSIADEWGYAWRRRLCVPLRRRPRAPLRRRLDCKAQPRGTIRIGRNGDDGRKSFELDRWLMSSCAILQEYCNSGVSAAHALELECTRVYALFRSRCPSLELHASWGRAWRHRRRGQPPDQVPGRFAGMQALFSSAKTSQADRGRSRARRHGGARTSGSSMRKRPKSSL